MALFGGGDPVSSAARPSIWVNFVQSLLAVLLGNGMYFLVMPSLPAAARHKLFRIDLGLLVDFWFCVVAFGLMKTAQWWRQRRRD
jgi:hypothetical protein